MKDKKRITPITYLDSLSHDEVQKMLAPNTVRLVNDVDEILTTLDMFIGEWDMRNSDCDIYVEDSPELKAAKKLRDRLKQSWQCLCGNHGTARIHNRLPCGVHCDVCFSKLADDYNRGE